MVRGVLVAAVLVLGCSGDPAPVPLDRFGEAAADAVCAWAVRCQHVPDDATCRRLLDPKQYDTRRALDAVAAGRLAYDDDAAGRCVATTREAYCLAEPFIDASCRAMFVGQVPEGELCTSGAECVGGGACANPQCTVQCCTGTCGPPLTGELPEPEGAALGEACEQHADCAEGAYCETDFTCTAVPTEEGARCLFGCARGDLYCDVEALVCRRFAAAGETCDPNGVDAPPCDDAWSYCDQVCTPRPGPGEPCDGIRRCIAATFCDNGTCQPRGGPGAPCFSADQCLVTCDGGTGQCAEYQVCEPSAS